MSQVTGSMLAGVSTTGIMVNSSVELSPTAAAEEEARAVGLLKQTLLSRSFASEYVVGNKVLKVGCCIVSKSGSAMLNR